MRGFRLRRRAGCDGGRNLSGCSSMMGFLGSIVSARRIEVVCRRRDCAALERSGRRKFRLNLKRGGCRS
jgi:hypothetical protein